ncbi:lysine histidine transporter 1 [Phtheirospermum japonicum]|uniref:Lysine histidine transporter 1 n=1 Tax=Phtheirospermum japonicum TaxID=374723 RepID=A0A830C7C7_9LAMI|nr:lysine histidine transporter 1 [Phtheirospermum japonicum]
MSWIVTLYTLWQMVEMHEMVPGKRFDRYHELGQHAFGEKLGLWIVVPLQLIVEVGVNIVYMILGGHSLVKFRDSVWNRALGSIAFGYAGHNVVLEIQSTMPSTPHKPSKGPMWKGVVVAYIIVALCYFPVAIIGYWAFGEKVGDNILVSLEKPKWLIATANIFVVIHLLGGYQIYAMPVFDMIETVLVRKLRLKPSWYLRFFARNTYVAFTMFVAVTLPFFDELLGFFGGFAFAPTTYFLPCIIWLVLKRPRRFSVSWFTNWVDERSAEERAIDDWLPITSSRTAKWWYSAFHNVTAIVGAGVLGLPYAMSEMGWGPGVTVLVISWIVTLYSLWQMVEMHEMVPGKRFDRYHELGQHAFGEKLGLWIVVPQQLVVEVGVDIVYMITGGQSLQKFHDLVCKECERMKLTYFILIFASVHFVLSQLPSFNSISAVSLAAAVMSLSYSTIAWGASIDKGVQPDVQYGYISSSTAGTVFNFFSALGSVVFAYGGHNVVMEIQATMPSSPDKPSKGPMWKGVLVAYIVVAICYVPVALVGYYMFGNAIYAMPVFDMMETVLVKKMKFRPTWYLRLVSRSTYVAFTTFIAITFPFFNGLLAFFGGFAFAPTTYFKA